MAPRSSRTAFLLPVLLGLSWAQGCQMFQAPTRERWHQGVVLMGGERQLDDEEDLPGLEDQNVYALGYDAYQLNAPLGFEAALTYADANGSFGTDGDADGSSIDLSLGARHTWQPDDLGVRGLYPYIGAGLALIHTEAELRSVSAGTVSESDFGGGVYLHFGIYGQFTLKWRIGIDCRFMRGDFLGTNDLNVDSDQLSAFLGWGF